MADQITPTQHPLDKAHGLYEQGRALMDKQAYPEALAALEESARFSPHFKTLELIGELMLLLGRPAEAVVPLAAATTLNPQVRAPSLLAKALMAVGDPRAARDAALLALGICKTNRIALDVLAQTEGLDDECGA